MNIDIEVCTCGFGPGTQCEPSCPGYKEPDPTKVRGTVSVDGSVKSRKPDNASYATFSFDGTENPVQLIGRDENRCRMLVISDGSVRIGRRNAVIAGGGASIPGATLTSPIVLENTDELWCAPDGAANVSIIVERYK